MFSYFGNLLVLLGLFFFFLRATEARSPRWPQSKMQSSKFGLSGGFATYRPPFALVFLHPGIAGKHMFRSLQETAQRSLLVLHRCCSFGQNTVPRRPACIGADLFFEGNYDSGDLLNGFQCNKVMRLASHNLLEPMQRETQMTVA